MTTMIMIHTILLFTILPSIHAALTFAFCAVNNKGIIGTVSAQDSMESVVYYYQVDYTNPNANNKDVGVPSQLIPSLRKYMASAVGNELLAGKVYGCAKSINTITTTNNAINVTAVSLAQGDDYILDDLPCTTAASCILVQGEMTLYTTTTTTTTTTTSTTSELPQVVVDILKQATNLPGAYRGIVKVEILGLTYSTPPPTITTTTTTTTTTDATTTTTDSLGGLMETINNTTTNNNNNTTNNNNNTTNSTDCSGIVSCTKQWFVDRYHQVQDLKKTNSTAYYIVIGVMAAIPFVLLCCCCFLMRGRKEYYDE